MRVLLHLIPNKKMVHKKYTYKNGKRFGPYYYETKRVNGKVVTTYLGSQLHSKNKLNWIYPVVGIVLLLVLLLVFFVLPGSFTGKVTLDMKSSYNSGELITGNLNLNLKSGELLPIDSVLTVSLGNVSKEFLLSDLVDSDTIEGNYFAEDTGISGSGQGFGIIGEKETYPEISFELAILESVSNSDSSSDSSSSDSSSDSDSSDSGTSDETSDSGDNIGGSDTDSETDSDSGTTDTDSGSDSGQEDSGEGNSGDTSSSDSSSDSSSSDSSSDSDTDSDSGTGDSGDVGITGGAISDSSNIVSGIVVIGEDFEYALNEGESVELVSGSVIINGEVVDDSVIQLKLTDGKVFVSTSYSVVEEGFGEEYLGEESLQLQIDIAEFGLIAEENSIFSINLVYGSQSVVNAEKDISVEEVVEETEIEPEVEEGAGIGIFNDTIINETINEIITNETLVNETIVNYTLVNQTIGNISIRTVQYGAVLGKPVKWVKNVSVDTTGNLNLSVEIPIEAENISVTKIAREKEEEDEAEETVGEDELENESNVEEVTVEEFENESNVEEVKVEEFENESNVEEVKVEEFENESNVEEVTVEITGNIVTGQVTADLELENEPAIVRVFKRFLRFTGFVVEEKKKTQEIAVEVNQTDKTVEIEYETPAPYALEENIGSGKRVKIVGPEEVHYENVLAFTQIDEALNVRNKENIRVYWNENNTYLNVENALDSDGNGIIDYVEWVVPHLSNQTFDIIVITKAEHLDGNRTFISDIYESVKALDGNWSETIPSGDYVRVVFEQNLTSDRDITIYPRVVSGNPRIQVYEINGGEIIAEFSNLINNGYNKVILSNLIGSQDTFDLLVLDGDVEFDHIIDPVTTLQLNADYVIADVEFVEDGGGFDEAHGLQMMWDVSSIPNGAIIMDSRLCLYIEAKTGSPDNDVRLWYINDQNWTESISATTINSQTKLNQTDDIWTVTTAGSYSCTNVTIQLLESFEKGNENFTIRLYDVDYPNIVAATIQGGIYLDLGLDPTYYRFDSREHTTSSQRPLLNVTYSAPQALVGAATGTGNNVTIETGFSHLSTNGTNLLFYSSFDSSNDSATAYDYHNDSHDGVLVNSANYTSAGFIGNAVTFPKTIDNRVQFEAGDYLNISRRNSTIVFWLKANDTSIEGLASTVDGSATAAGWALGNSNGQTIGLRIQGGTSGTQQTLSTTSLTNNRWHHIAVIVDDTGATPYAYAYIDNVKNAVKFYGTQTSHNYYDGVNQLFLGDWSAWGHTNSTIDELMIFDKGLSDAEVTAIYNNQSARFYSRGEQIFTELNVSGDGTENRVNVTLNQSLLFGAVNFSVQIGDSGAGSYSYGAETQISTTTGTANDITISTLHNISVKLIYWADADKFYTPILQGNIILDSWTGAAADSTPPEVTINVPENKTYGSFDLPINFNVSLNEQGSVLYSLDGGSSNTTMFSGTGADKIGQYFNSSISFLVEGSYVFTAFANDTSGNKNFTQNVTFSYDDFALNTCANITTANSIYTLQSNVSTSSNCFVISANNVTLDFNGFTLDSSSSVATLRGIDIGNFNDTVVRNGTLTDFATQVYINEGDGAKFNNMKFSGTLSSIGLGDLFYGIRIDSDARNIVVENTTFGPMSATGLLSSAEGIYIEGGQNITLRNNTFTLLSGTSSSSAVHLITGVSDGSIDTARSERNLLVNLKDKGMYLEGGRLTSMYDEIQNTTSPILISSGLGSQFNHTFINGSDVSASSGVVALIGTSVDETVLSNLTITGTASGDYDIYIVDGADSTRLVESVLSRYDIGSATGAYFIYQEDQNGQIRFLNIMNATGENITYDFQLNNNFAFVNSTNSAINLSANITFFNMPGSFTNPFIARDGVECTNCYNFTSLNDATVIFNVTSWTNYSIMETPDVLAPNVTIHIPLNAKTYYTPDLPLNFNVSLNEQGSVLYSLDDGVNNLTMFSGTGADKVGQFFNSSNSSIADGTYIFHVYANDTVGNKNFTQTATFTFENTDVDSCRTLDSSKTYTITGDLTSTGTTCLNVTANNVRIEGQGHLIDGDDSIGTFGIVTSRTSNLTINNLTVRDYDYGLFLDTYVNDTVVENITVTSTGTYGIYFFMVNNTLVKDVNVSTNDGRVIFITTNTTGKSMSGSISESSFINNVDDSVNIQSLVGVVRDNFVSETQGFGILASAVAGVNSEVSVINNTIEKTQSGSLSCSSGVGLSCQVFNNTLRLNNGTNVINVRDRMVVDGNIIHNNTGYAVSRASAGSIDDVIIRNNHIYNNSRGISIVTLTGSGANNYLIQNNYLNLNGYGFYLTGDFTNKNHTFTNNTINGSINDAIYLNGTNVGNLTFNNLTITSTNVSKFDLNVSTAGINDLTFNNTVIKNYTFTGTGSTARFLQNNLGEIYFFLGINGSGGNLTEDVQIRNNLADVKSANNIGLNKSANITFYNMPGTFTHPAIYRDSSECTDCYNFTSLNDATVIFNVTSWTNYSIMESKFISQCGVLDASQTYTITGNLASIGTDCLNVTAHNVRIEGAGFTIDGDDTASTSGIVAVSVNNLTVNNLTISDYAYGININLYGNVSVIENVTITSTTTAGIYLFLVNDTTIRNSNISDNLLSGIYVSLNTSASSATAIDFSNINLFYNGGDAFNIYSAIGTIRDSWAFRSNESSLDLSATTGISSNVTVLNNTLEGAASQSLLCSNIAGNNCAIINNTLRYNTGAQVISLKSDTLVEGNIIHNNTGNAISRVGSPSINRVTIKNNHIYNNSIGINMVTATTGSSSNFIVENNYLNSVGYGFYLTGTAANNHHIFTNNTINGSIDDAILLTIGANIGNLTFNNLTITSTNVSKLDLNVSTAGINDLTFNNLVLANYTFAGTGSIAKFTNNLDGEILFFNGINGSGGNLTDDVSVDFNFAEGKSENNYGINASANITFYNMPGSFRYPKIYRDSVICTSCYNFTSLNDATVIFNVTGFSNYSILESNSLQTPVPKINSTYGTNYTTENLTGFDNLIDPDGDFINVTVQWFNNSVLHLTQDYNNSYANGTLFQASLTQGNTTKHQNWTFGMRLFDGLTYTSWANSSALEIRNTPPSMPILNTPQDASSTTDRTPNLGWLGLSDVDGDTKTYEINVTCAHTSGGSCVNKGDDTRHITGISGLSHDLASELLYLYDNGYQYNWSARAYDGEDYSDWSSFRRINISALIEVSLPVDSINFGTLAHLSTNETSDDSPAPFLIQNDGNVLVNVTIGATNLWNTAQNPSAYYQFKIANYTAENASFNWVKSIVTYTNMFSDVSPSLAIAYLNNTNATDTAEIDINVTVPSNEGPNAKSSSVTLTASLADEGEASG